MALTDTIEVPRYLTNFEVLYTEMENVLIVDVWILKVPVTIHVKFFE